ncbi:MAG TPA: SdpI family protein [Longimicrobiales bacterium]
MSRRWVGLVVVAGMFVLALAVFPWLPERIPVHWNARGEADGWAGRWPGAFIGPLVGLGVWVLLWLLPKIDPRRARYEAFWGTYWLIANLVIVFLALLEVLMLGAALGWGIDVTQVVLIAVGILFVVLGRQLPRVQPNWWMGIRTPWTLEDDRVWRETHELAGRTFVAGGLLTVVGALLPAEVRPWVALAGLGLAGFVPVVYSYLAWRRRRREGAAGRGDQRVGGSSRGAGEGG